MNFLDLNISKYMDILERILNTSKRMEGNGKTLKDAAIKFGEESGEVLGVVSILTGLSSYKEVHPLDLCDELADVLTNVVDLGFIHYGEGFLNLLSKSVDKKCKKWEDNYIKSKI